MKTPIALELLSKKMHEYRGIIKSYNSYPHEELKHKHELIGLTKEKIHKIHKEIKTLNDLG